MIPQANDHNKEPFRLLPPNRTILERPYMLFRPFGMDEQGEKIRDVSGVIVSANLEFLQECIARERGEAAGRETVERLCIMLNERIPDATYHVTEDFLRNTWNSYSYEFVCYLREFGKLLSGEPNFVALTAEHKQISSVIRVLCRAFSIRQIYGMVPYLGEKFSRGIETQVNIVGNSSAVVRMRFTERAKRQFGAYRAACAALACESAKGGLQVLPEKVHDLPRAIAVDRSCMVNGDEWCEWKITWSSGGWRWWTGSRRK